MAGDIGIQEHALILPTGGAAEFAAAVLPPAQGQVRHVYGPRLVIAGSRDGGGRALAAESDVASEETRRQLTPAEVLGLDAFGLRQSTDYANAKANRQHDGADWDAGPAMQPACYDITGTKEGTFSLDAGAPTSQRLTGSVAVGIIIVEGPTPALKFTAAERTKVVAEVQNGLGWLGSQNPEGVTWTYDIQIVSIPTEPGPDSLDAGQKESLWRDPAMAKLGYGAGMAGVTAYVNAIRTRFGTTWGYCAFFTKYPIYHFAYASIGGPRIVMDYANDGWGPDNIDRVFAHESGHIFGAPDEYAASGCNCGGSWGFYGKPNLNCASCAPSGGVDCLMKANSWAMCPSTPYHLGFPLVEQSYSGVWRGGTDAHYLWVNASWASFNSKWQQLAGQGLRLVDLKITRDGSTERYHGAWRSATGGYYLWVNADWPKFLAKWQALSAQGLRLVDIEVTNFDGQLRYSGVWLPGTDAHYLWVNADWPSFQAKWQELAAQNLRLTDLRIVNVGGQDRFFGVWRAGTGGHYLWVNADWQNFTAKWQQLAGQGLRLIDFDITGTNAQRRYSGVWLPGNDAYYLWVGANWQAFKAKFEELSAQNLRLVAIDVVPAGGPQSPLPGQAIAVPEIQLIRQMADAYAGRSPAAPGHGGHTAGHGAALHLVSAGEEDGFGAGDPGPAAQPSGEFGADDGRGFGGGDPTPVATATGHAALEFGGGGFGAGQLEAELNAAGTGQSDSGSGFGGGDAMPAATSLSQGAGRNADGAGYGAGVIG